MPLGVRTRIFNTQPKFSAWLAYWTSGQQRLLGAYGIRASLVFTLQVSATPFHQGLVCLNFQYGAEPGAAGNGCFFRSTNSCTSTNLPHVTLDMSSDTMVKLKLPYLAPAEYSRIQTAFQDFTYGCLALNVLTAIPAVPGMNAPSYQIYLHLEDIELFGAAPQTTVNIQLNAGRKLSPVTEEFEKDSHPYSSALYSAGKAVHYIAKGVPSLSSIGGITSWALGKAAGVVRAFGYGKPAVIDPVVRMTTVDTVGEFNTDVASALFVLAPTANNTTAISTDVGYSDVDEMALSYVTSRWGQICVFNIDTSVNAGIRVYATSICPLSWWFRAPASLPAYNHNVSSFATATTNSVQPSHLMWAASSFKQWRGGVKFRFTFAKTKMHAGRVMVAFNPDLLSKNLEGVMNDPQLVNVASYGTLGPDPFGYSAVFDLKDGNVFDFEVPFISPTPYVNIGTTVGTLAMFVVNPLIAPSVVSSSIQCMVEIAGMSDFELANPAGILLPAHNAGTILQSGRILSEAPEIVNQRTMGEAITSVKQLISIPHVKYYNNPGPSPYSIAIPPWFFHPTYSALTPSTISALSYSFSYGGNWASCYAFLKGGTDFHAYATTESNWYKIIQLPGLGGLLSTNNIPANRSCSNAPTILNTNNAMHVRLPGYYSTARIYSWIANIIPGAGTTWSNSLTFTTSPVDLYIGLQTLWALVVGNITDGASTFSHTSRNASDDAQMAMYIGPPPVWLPVGPAVTGLFDPDSNPRSY